MLIYPEGIWYGEVTPERCERIVEKHLIGSAPIQEWVVLENPLGA
jgi:(2Fe-2S) ferredoxin